MKLLLFLLRGNELRDTTRNNFILCCLTIGSGAIFATLILLLCSLFI